MAVNFALTRKPGFLKQDGISSALGGPLEARFAETSARRARLTQTLGGLVPMSNAEIRTAINNPNSEINSKSALVDGSAVLNSGNPNSIKASKHYGSYFLIPTTGWNWGILHLNNAVDIANDCGTPIYAAAEGLITESFGDNAWNQGYGNYILIEHPNKTETLYAHLGKNETPVGKYVLKGDLIAKMGATGNTHGPTGCHLHFEVRGAANPLAE